MSYSMSQASLPVFEIGLKALSAILEKAKLMPRLKIDASVLLHSRLSPDMFALARQVPIPSDQAKNGSARLPASKHPATKITRRRSISSRTASQKRSPI